MSKQGFNTDFELIRQAMGSIEFFRELYASSTPSTENAQACIAGLRAKANSTRQSDPHATALFDKVAEGLELYIGLKPLNA